VEAAERELGRACLYVAQLSDLLDARAVEANDLHDDLAAARARIADLESQLATRTATEG
jgi:hypothetical protein